MQICEYIAFVESFCMLNYFINCKLYNKITFFHIYYFVIYSQLFGLIKRSLFDLLYRIGSVKEVGAVKRDIVLEVGILLAKSYIVILLSGQ